MFIIVFTKDVIDTLLSQRNSDHMIRSSAKILFNIIFPPTPEVYSYIYCKAETVVSIRHMSKLVGAPFIINLGNGRKIVSLTASPLYPRKTSPVCH